MRQGTTIVLDKFSYAVLGVCFCLFALSMGYVMQIAPYLKGRDALENWKRVPAVVLSHNFVLGDGDSASYSDITYEYVVDGEKFRSSAVSIWPHQTCFSVKRVVPGFEMECYVNPANSSEALLDADAPLSWFWGILLGLFFLGGFCGLLHAFQRDPQVPEPIFFGRTDMKVESFPATSALHPLRVRTLKVLDNRLEYRVRNLYHGILLLCFLLGLGLAIYGINEFTQIFYKNSTGNFIWAVFGSIIAGVSFHAWRAMNAKCGVFDLVMQIYYCDKKMPLMTDAPLTLQDYTPLKEVVALQVLAVELLCNDARPIPCFEINLVKRDGGRVNVVSHRDRNNIILDAQILSEYLRLPIVGKV